MTGDFLQRFRVLSPSLVPVNNPTIVIPSRPDPKTKERIVLWRDIQNEVKNADRVRNGEVSIVFMAGEDFEELVPRRIQYHHGVVLDLIVTSQDQETTGRPKTVATSTSSIQDLSLGESNSGSRDTDRLANFASTVQHVCNLSIATADAVDRSLVTQSSLLDQQEEMSIQKYSQSNEVLCTTDNPKRLIQVPSVDQFIAERLKMMEMTGIQEGDLLQWHIIQQQQQILDKLQQTLNRQAVHENRIQALMTQNYELHEYPIPRLFIVLPKPMMRRRDKFTRPLFKQFRLYFLCECGEHTIRTGRGTFPSKIHLAKHEGYDLDQPNEFFKRYGSYVLALLKFLKYGAMAAGVAIPPLALFKISDSLEAIQKSLTSTIGNVESLVDETIKYIQGLDGNINTEGGSRTGAIQMEDIEALEGADLRQLQLYLNDKDKGRVLGDLFRIFTYDGHVKWVCIDHYNENYRKVAVQRFQDVVAANKGTFYQWSGVKISLGSNTVAKQFYEAMVKARGVVTLDVTLEWDVTMDDLRVFAAAVTKANIAKLTMSGEYFKGPVFDMINNGRRFNPILGIMCNERIQSMELYSFENFYQHIDVSCMTTATQLRSLALGSMSYPRKYQYNPEVWKILKRCPCLTHLSIFVVNVWEALDDLKARLSTLSCPKRVILGCHPFRLSMNVFESKILSMDFRVATLEAFKSNAPMLTTRGVTGLDMSFPIDCSLQQVVDVVRCNPQLRYMYIKSSPHYLGNLIDSITSTRKMILSDGGSPILLRVSAYLLPELLRQSLTHFFMTVEFHNGSTTPILSSYFGMGARLILGCDPCALLESGRLIDTLGMIAGFSNKMASILDKSTDMEGSRITSMVLDPYLLSTECIECMDRVIERSHNLQRLEIQFRNLDEEDQQEKMERWIRQYSNRLSGLELEGKSEDVWMPKVMAICPTRSTLPRLESFILKVRDHPLSLGCVQWIADMVSTSRQVPSISMTSQSSSSDVVSASRVHGCESSFLTPMEYVGVRLNLHPDNWEVIIKALDCSSLKILGIGGEGFTLDQFKLLVDNSSVITKSPLTVNLHSFQERDEEVQAQLARLRAKVPKLHANFRDSHSFGSNVIAQIGVLGSIRY
ncbi:hypothetical protein B0O80DRAFT_503081 [Mortierella sp. GBAus27b]|nr:hypothetical protein BGX31_010051 [Mortierella sp. GBA43]KAI8346960.1 hypothetical protein B0O80DRAFT_503081 [Mortierella sp. GBAus27b]